MNVKCLFRKYDSMSHSRNKFNSKIDMTESGWVNKSPLLNEISITDKFKHSGNHFANADQTGSISIFLSVELCNKGISGQA